MEGSRRQTRGNKTVKWPGICFSPAGLKHDRRSRLVCSGLNGLYGALPHVPYVNFEILPVTKWST